MPLKLTKPYNYIWLILGLLCSFILSSQNRKNFIHLPFKSANQNIRVTHSVEDSLGYIWLAHSNGISIYDGYNYRFMPSDSLFASNSSDRVKKIFKDSYNTIWALSANGKLSYLGENGIFSSFNKKIDRFLDNHKIDIVKQCHKKLWLVSKKGNVFLYDQNTNQVNNISEIPNKSDGFPEITEMVVGKHDRLVFSTYYEGVYSYSMSTNKMEKLSFPSKYPVPEWTTLEFDKKNRLWIGSSYGGGNDLLIYDFDKKAFVQDDIFEDPVNELFISMYCAKNGTIWLGTDGNGLYKINPDSGNIQVFKNNELNEFSLGSNTVMGINEDLNNNLWVLTNYGDINILPNDDNQFHYHSGSLRSEPTRVLSTFKAIDGTLWIGTDGEGVTKVSPSGDEEQFFTNTDESIGYYIHTLNQDKNNNIWVGTYKNGLWIYNTKTKTFNKKSLKNSKSFNVWDVRYIYRDSKQRMWLATDLGIYVYEDDNTLLAAFENDTHGFTGDISQSIVEDEWGTIWVGYNTSGLFRFDENSINLSESKFINQTNIKEQGFTGKNHDIVSMAPDNNGAIWITSANGALSKFDIQSGKIKSIKIKEKPSNVSFRSVVVENKNSIWLGSSNGIWHYNLNDSIATVFYESDGLQDILFKSRSAYQDADGFLYFGGLNGVNYFKPNQIKKKKINANLYINEIEILNRPAMSLIPNQINEGVEKLKKLELKHNQSSFSFRFLALDNVLFPNFNYAYRLKGFNDSWILSKNERLATYTNIPPGDYTFEVKARSGEDKWDIGQKSITIFIAPPFWNTRWAHLLYVLLITGLIYGIIIWTRLRNKLHTEEIQHNHDKEIFALKMDFFAKMSHEIQTPLTLILIPLDNMLKRALQSGDTLLQQRLGLISNNAKRLSKIVFELTSLRDKELEKLVLRPSENNIVGDLKEIAKSFKEQAKFREISFKCNFPGEELSFYYDKNKMEHIFYNLLANAFKFTPKGGSVVLDVIIDEWEKMVKISITDSGPGIPQAELDNIFQLFYQVNSGKEKTGTGIGLALTKELVDLHKGEIHVKSKPKKGTCFSVSFPIEENQIVKAKKNAQTNRKSVKPDIISTDKKNIGNHSKKKLTKTILIVEDNFELQISLKDIFGDYYNVILADNGEEGFELAKEYIPNLIISDIMMPKVDGLEMSTMLQENSLTSHIPIILLTAKKEQENKILGLRTGAIEYINKPFNTNELILKANNIITRSDRLLLNFKNDLISTPKVGQDKSKDEIFLEKLVSLIEDQMSNPDFKLEGLAENFHMSYSAMYRKFQSLTGKKIVDFVRTMRLKKALVLITDCNYAISEAAYIVGFNDPKYFSRCFKKEFGKRPAEYKKQSSTSSETV